MTKQEQLAYAAGLLDGEGCFHASRNEHCNTFRYGLTVNMNADAPLRRLAGLFGGEVRKVAGYDHYTWSPARSALLRMVDDLRPFLIIKAPQADCVAQLRKNFETVGRKVPSELDMMLRYSLTKRTTELKKDLDLKPFPNMSERCVSAYTAGLVDAEGCIGIYHVKDKYYGKVQIGMTDPSSIALVQSVFGGACHKSVHAGATAVFYLSFERQKTVAICKAILPYLTAKYEQAELVIRIANHISLWNTKRRGSAEMPQEVIVKRREWYARSLALNSKFGRAETKSSRGLPGSSDSPTCREPQAAEPEEIAGRCASAQSLK